VVNYFSNENREAGRDGGIAERYERILKPILLMAGRNSIWFGLAGKECGDLGVEICDAFFGPLNFSATSGQQISQGSPP
jgi:hypothetical protein